MHRLYKPCPKDAVYQISEYLDNQFMRRFFKIHKILPLFAPYGAPKCVSFIMFTNYNNTCSIHNRHYTDEKYSVKLLVNILEIY